MIHARSASTSLTDAITSPSRSHHGRSAGTTDAGPLVTGCVAVQRGNATTVGCVTGAALAINARAKTFRAATVTERPADTAAPRGAHSRSRLVARLARPPLINCMGRSLRHAHSKFN